MPGISEYRCLLLFSFAIRIVSGGVSRIFELRGISRFGSITILIGLLSPLILAVRLGSSAFTVPIAVITASTLLLNR